MISIMIILTISIFLLNSRENNNYINRDELIGVKYRTKSTDSYSDWTGTTFPTGGKPKYEISTSNTKCYDNNGNVITNTSSNYIMTYNASTGNVQLTINKPMSCNLYFDKEGTGSSSGGGGSSSYSEHCEGNKLVNSDGDWVGYCPCTHENATSWDDCETDDIEACANRYVIYTCGSLEWAHGTGPCYEGPETAHPGIVIPGQVCEIQFNDSCYSYAHSLENCSGYRYCPNKKCQ